MRIVEAEYKQGQKEVIHYLMIIEEWDWQQDDFIQKQNEEAMDACFDQEISWDEFWTLIVQVYQMFYTLAHDW